MIIHMQHITAFKQRQKSSLFPVLALFPVAFYSAYIYARVCISHGLLFRVFIFIMIFVYIFIQIYSCLFIVRQAFYTINCNIVECMAPWQSTAQSVDGGSLAIDE